MPALMPTRTESAVYFDQQAEHQQAEHFLAATGRLTPSSTPRSSTSSCGRWRRCSIATRDSTGSSPEDACNQRDGIWISFTAKTALSEEGTLVEVKHHFDPRQPFADLVGELQQETTQARSGAHGLADRELELFLHLPPRARRGVVRLASLANAWRLLPRVFVDGDPFFASAFVTNLGSVGLDSAYHHLYEYGTIPIFCALGDIHDAVVVDDGQPRSRESRR